MRILIQFIGQAIGLILLRRKRSPDEFPFKMPFFPWPIYIAIAMWVGILLSTGITLVISGLIVISIGAAVYFIKAKVYAEWPFEKKTTNAAGNN